MQLIQNRNIKKLKLIYYFLALQIAAIYTAIVGLFVETKEKWKWWILTCVVCFIAFLVGVLCLLPVSIRYECFTIILQIISTPFWISGRPSSRSLVGRVYHWSHGGHIHGAGINCFRLDLRAGIAIQRLRVCAWIQTVLRVEICVAGQSHFVYGMYREIHHKFIHINMIFYCCEIFSKNNNSKSIVEAFGNMKSRVNIS